MKKKWIYILIAVCVASGVGIWWWKAQKSSKPQFREYEVAKGNIEVNILSTGMVSPENRLEVKVPVPGRVEQALAKEGSFVKRGELLAFISSTERAALLDAARSKGEDEYRKWEEIYKPTQVLAPISGTVILRKVEPGQTFTSQDALFVMSNRLTIKAQVDETDVGQVKLKQKAEIVLDAYPQLKFYGVAEQISFDAKTTNNVTTYTVDVTPTTPPEQMRSGMTANVTFFVEKKEGVLTLPNETLKVREGKFYVLVKEGKGSKEAFIQTGITDGKKTEILSGLTETDVVLNQELKLGGNGQSGGSLFSPMVGGSPRRPGAGGGGGH